MNRVDSYMSFMAEAEQLALLGAYDRMNEVFDHMMELREEMTAEEVLLLEQRFAMEDN